MKTLLVPVDFSNATSLVIAKAAELARQLSARVVLLHVTEPVATYVPVGASMDILSAAPPPIQTDNPPEIEARLETLSSPLREAGLTVDCVAVVGLAVDDILEQAGKLSADYIILGSHGHGALYHLFSGSVVTGVLKRAACPVIVIPSAIK